MSMNFHKGLMASEVIPTQLVSGVYYVSARATAVGDGALVVVGDLMAHDVYASTTDLNVHKVTAPAALTDRVAVVDYVGVPTGAIGDNQYRVGYATYGLQVPAGTVTRVRRLSLDDTYWTDADNFATAPTVGQYATATAGTVQYTPAATVPNSGFCVKIEASKPVTTGTVNSSTEYLCTVVQL